MKETKLDKGLNEYFEEWGKKIQDGTIKIKVHRSKMALDYIKPDEECLTYDEDGCVIYRYDTYYVRRDLSYGAYRRFIDLNEELGEDPLDLNKPGYESLPLEDEPETDDCEDFSDDIDDEDECYDLPDRDEHERFLEKLNEEEKLEERIKKMD